MLFRTREELIQDMNRLLERLDEIIKSYEEMINESRRITGDSGSVESVNS